MRPTYQALLASEWLKDLGKPETIKEEEEEADENEASDEAVAGVTETMNIRLSGTEDLEVAAWVKGVLEKKATGQYGEAAGKPALHAAPLDAIGSPLGSPHGAR